MLGAVHLNEDSLVQRFAIFLQVIIGKLADLFL